MIQNVANGKVSAQSTDAINGSQLYAVNKQASDALNKLNNGAAGTVQYSDSSSPTTANGGTVTNDVTLVGQDNKKPVALHNVAGGTAPTDAVNVAQLDTFSSGMSHELKKLQVDVNRVQDEASAGVAGAMAMANLTQSNCPGKMMITGGVSTYNGQSAVAVGLSSSSQTGNFIINLNGSADSEGKTGASFSFGKYFD